MADPEERRSFMDMRLLLVRGDMGDAESLPASPRAGLSPRRISRQEPEEEEGSGVDERGREQGGGWGTSTGRVREGGRRRVRAETGGGEEEKIDKAFRRGHPQLEWTRTRRTETDGRTDGRIDRQTSYREPTEDLERKKLLDELDG